MTTETESSDMDAVYDEPWKEITETYFADFILFFFPKIHQMINWTKEPVFLDKELQQIISPLSSSKDKHAVYVDKLVQVQLLDGTLEVIYIHIEIQSQYDHKFSRRMFDYNYLLSKRYNQQVVSLAVLGDNRPKWKPTKYEKEQCGCKILFEFPSVKLLDYKNKWKELGKNKNPFSIFIRAHLKSKETTNKAQKRYDWKLTLIKLLHKEGYTEKQIFNLFRFIDWMMTLPSGLKEKFELEIAKYEEQEEMSYMSFMDRRVQRGIEEGMEKGIQEGIKKGIKEGIKKGKQEGRQEERNEIILRIFKTMGNNLDTISKLVGFKKEEIQRILKKEGML